jgi:predicted DNA-binding transcriptional regulator AlpA
MSAATYTADEFAELLGCSTWAIYEGVRRGDCPLPPIRIGRRLVWPRATVDRLLGLDGPPAGAGVPHVELLEEPAT